MRKLRFLSDIRRHIVPQIPQSLLISDFPFVESRGRQLPHEITGSGSWFFPLQEKFRISGRDESSPRIELDGQPPGWFRDFLRVRQTSASWLEASIMTGDDKFSFVLRDVPAIVEVERPTAMSLSPAGRFVNS
jgi:hypothetical protein